MIIFKDLITGFYNFFQLLVLLLFLTKKKLLKIKSKSNFELTVI